MKFLQEIVWYFLDISVIFIRNEIVLMLSILNIFCLNSFWMLGKCGIAVLRDPRDVTVISRKFLTIFILPQNYRLNAALWFHREFYWRILIGGGSFWFLRHLISDLVGHWDFKWCSGWSMLCLCNSFSIFGFVFLKKIIEL